jgi:hypothetical protein
MSVTHPDGDHARIGSPPHMQLELARGENLARQ